MKIIVKICGVIFLLFMIFVIRIENPRKYTNEEFQNMSSIVLLNTFIDNGLIIPDKIKENFNNSNEEIAIFLKRNFELFSQGISVYGYTEYFELSESFKDTYDKLILK